MLTEEVWTGVDELGGGVERRGGGVERRGREWRGDSEAEQRS